MTRKIIFKLPKKFHKRLSLTQAAMALNRAPAVLKEIKELIQKHGLALPVTIEIVDETGEIEFTGAYRFNGSTSANLLVLVRDKLFTPEMAQIPTLEKEKFLGIIQDDLALPLAEETDEAATEVVDDTMSKEKAETPSKITNKPKRVIFRRLLFSLIEIMFLLVLAFGFRMLLRQNVAPSYFVGIGTSVLMFLGLISVSLYLKKMSGARRFETQNSEILPDYVPKIAEEDLAELEADYLQEVSAENLPYPIEETIEAIIPQEAPVSEPPKQNLVEVKEKQPAEFRNNQTVIPIKHHHKKQNGGTQLSLSKADVTKRELSEHLKRSMSQATTTIQSQIDDKQAEFFDLCQNISSLEDVKRSQILIDDIYQLEVSLEAFQNGELIDEAEAPAHAQTL
ncbi:hypothetical protein RyT2_14160 [Pseudolactococcus yaeyamensis]